MSWEERKGEEIRENKGRGRKLRKRKNQRENELIIREE